MALGQLWSALISSKGSVEIATFCGILLAVEVAIPGPASLHAVSPHPLWIPVLLAAAQYGTTVALATVMAAVGVYVFGGLPSRWGIEDFYGYWLRVCREPALWLVAAIVLGQISRRHMELIGNLTAGLQEADRQRQQIASYCNDVAAHLIEVERQLALSDSHSIRAGLATLAELRSSTRETAPAALRRTMLAFLGDCTYRVYARIDDRNVMLGDLSTNERAVGATRFDGVVPEATLEALARLRRVLSISREQDARFLKEAAMAAPILDGTGAAMIGAICIEVMDASRLTGESELALQFICANLSMVLVHEVGGESQRDRSVGVSLYAA